MGSPITVRHGALTTPPWLSFFFYMAMATTADDTTNGSKGLSKQKWLFLPSIIAGMDNRKAKEG